MTATTENKPAVPTIYRAKEAAKILTISERHLYSLTQRGAIKAVRMGDKSIRYTADELAAFVERSSAH